MTPQRLHAEPLASICQGEDIVQAPWRHGELPEQGSRTGRCGWITSFLRSNYSKKGTCSLIPRYAVVGTVVEGASAEAPSLLFRPCLLLLSPVWISGAEKELPRCAAWIYREGRDRDFWVVETSAPFLDIGFDAAALVGTDEGLAYARGYFDAEGGMPRSARARFYVQFTQKDRANLREPSPNPRSASSSDRHACWGCGVWHSRKLRLIQERVAYRARQTR